MDGARRHVDVGAGPSPQKTPEHRPSMRGIHALLSRSAVAQGLFSLVNLGLSVFVLMTASKVDFGRYTLVLAAVVFFVAIASSLIYLQLPMWRRGGHNQACYFATLYRLLMHVAWALAAAVAVFAGIAMVLGWLGPRAASLTCIGGLLTLAYVRAEFIKQMLYVLEDVAAVVRVNLRLALGVGSGCGATLLSGTDEVLFSVLLIFSLGLWLCVAGKGAEQLKSCPPGRLRDMAARVWRPGRWALMNALFVWLPSQGYLYLLGAVAGLGTVAEVGAARNVVAPLQVLATSFQQVVLPRLATLGDDAIRRVNRIRHDVLRTLLLIFSGYVLLLYLLQPMAVDYLLAERGYAAFERYVGLWVLVTTTTVYRSNLAVIYQALNRYDLIARLGLAYAIAASLLFAVMIPFWGGSGALLGLALAEGVFVILLRSRLRAEQRLTAWEW